MLGHWEITLPNIAVMVALIVGIGIFACGLGWCIVNGFLALFGKLWKTEEKQLSKKEQEKIYDRYLKERDKEFGRNK